MCPFSPSFKVFPNLQHSTKPPGVLQTTPASPPTTLATRHFYLLIFSHIFVDFGVRNASQKGVVGAVGSRATSHITAGFPCPRGAAPGPQHCLPSPRPPGVTHSWVRKMTVSSAKATEAARPMSRFSKRVATNVTIQIIWRKGHFSRGTVSPWHHGVEESKKQEQSPGAGWCPTRSTRLDFQSMLKSENCLNMPLRLTMMMADKMA